MHAATHQTLSPTLSVAQPVPTLATTPATSDPSTCGRYLLAMDGYRSLGLTELAMTLMRTSHDDCNRAHTRGREGEKERERECVREKEKDKKREKGKGMGVSQIKWRVRLTFNLSRMSTAHAHGWRGGNKRRTKGEGERRKRRRREGGEKEKEEKAETEEKEEGQKEEEEEEEEEEEGDTCVQGHRWPAVHSRPSQCRHSQSARGDKGCTLAGSSLPPYVLCRSPTAGRGNPAMYACEFLS